MDILKTIETKRLILIHLNINDFEFFSRIIKDKSISENLNYIFNNINIENLELLFKSITNTSDIIENILSYLVLRRDTNDYIGLCGLRLLMNKKEAYCFYYLIPLYRGSGFAIESMKKIIELGFLKLNLSKISIFINPNSTKVWKVAERTGMKYLGHVKISGVHSKAMYFSIEKKEFYDQHII
ncbi:MAG: GNAT family N-acetyltransferase [Candidatus Hermodarchaeota archaeon]